MLRKEMREVIVEFLHTHPVSQSDLARLSGVSMQTINEIVLGKSPDTKLQTKTENKIKEAMRKCD